MSSGEDYKLPVVPLSGISSLSVTRDWAEESGLVEDFTVSGGLMIDSALLLNPVLSQDLETIGTCVV